MSRIQLHDRTRLALPLSRLGLFFFGNFQDTGNIRLLQTAVRRKKLQTVAVIRQVTGRNHNGTVSFNVLKDRGHKHGRCRCQAAVKSLYAGTGQASTKGRLYVLCRNTGIGADCNS